MSKLRLLVVADRADGELFGLRGEFGAGVAHTAESFDEAPKEGPSELIVVVGNSSLPSATGVPAVRLLDREPAAAEVVEMRTVAPAGEGLWSCQPWPVADPVFELGQVAGSVLVVGGREERREQLLSAVHERGLEVHARARLDIADLERASVVLFAGADAGAMPVRAMAVLAAGRILIAPAASPTFGLQPGLDHLRYRTVDGAVNLCESVALHTRAFDGMRIWARMAAERHRASLVYDRMAGDLALEQAG